jgi:hypothetical protein
MWESSWDFDLRGVERWLRAARHEEGVQRLPENGGGSASAEKPFPIT